MKWTRATRFILISGLCGVMLSLLIAQGLTRMTIKHDAQFQVESINRQLEIFNSALTQLAAFLSEPGDLNEDGHVVRRLNRFVYGNAGILGIELKTKNSAFINSQASSGEFVNGGIALPNCVNDGIQINVGPQTLSACDDGRLAILKHFEDFDGNPFVLKLVLNPASLAGGNHIESKSGEASSVLSCSMNGASKSPCSVHAPGELSRDFLKEFLPRFGISLALSALLILILLRLVVIPLGAINQMLTQVSRAESGEDFSFERLGVLRLFREPVKAITELLRAKASLETKNAAAEARTRVSDEVAHNIRSPLAVLRAVEKDIASSPEDTRVAFRSAVNRIGDIINLLDVPRGAKKSDGKKQKHLISSLIEVFLSETRRQYAGNKQIEFSVENNDDTYGVFAEVDSTSFKTILSNLINNAVEATPSNRKGKITISLRPGNQSFCEVLITDNGVGMSAEILDKVTTEGFTYGKSTGKGLGLFHAKSVIESWGGNLEVKSTVGHGTQIKISLIKADAPAWFLPSLNIPRGATIAIVDDDPSVHHLWKSRIGSIANLVDFQSGLKFREEIQSGAQFDLALVDFELIGEDETGLDLIRSLELQKIAVLVTSRFEDEQVRLDCESLQIRLLPKMLAPQVPLSRVISVENTAKNEVDAIFLDDDPMSHVCWQIAGKGSGKKILYFSSIDEFFGRIENYSKDIPIFVDFNFEGQELNGIQVCERLRNLGYSKLQLATGARFDDLPAWLPNVGKDFPFSRNADVERNSVV